MDSADTEAVNQRVCQVVTLKQVKTIRSTCVNHNFAPRYEVSLSCKALAGISVFSEHASLMGRVGVGDMTSVTSSELEKIYILYLHIVLLLDSFPQHFFYLFVKVLYICL